MTETSDRMACEHRWKAILVEHPGQTVSSWQICDACGARRVVSSYMGLKGRWAQEEHPWPEHVPEAVEEAMRGREAVDHPSRCRKDTGQPRRDPAGQVQKGRSTAVTIRYGAEASPGVVTLARTVLYGERVLSSIEMAMEAADALDMVAAVREGNDGRFFGTGGTQAIVLDIVPWESYTMTWIQGGKRKTDSMWSSDWLYPFLESVERAAREAMA